MVPNIAVILTDKKKKILWVNQDFVEMTGYALGEVIGRSPGQVLQGPSSQMEAIDRIRKGLENRVAVKDELINYRKNGEPYVCKLVIHPIFGADQELTHFIAFEVDGDIIEIEEDLPLMNLSQKYTSSSLKGVEEVKLYFKLKELLQREELYLEPNLTLKNIADRLSTNTKYLSQVVNNHSGSNFQHFINDYRIVEAQKQILDKDNENLTLYGIALQCGFKNKSTFYKVFKEITGKTPREFQKQNGIV